MPTGAQTSSDISAKTSSENACFLVLIKASSVVGHLTECLEAAEQGVLSATLQLKEIYAVNQQKARIVHKAIGAAQDKPRLCGNLGHRRRK
jgi:hypothetical protein